jgi:microcystin-dependent protein
MSFLSDRRIQDSLPAGVVLPFAGTAAPDGWLLCDGSAISRTTYARLFASIGTSFGVGDGSGTFNLPNTQGVFIRGAGSQTISVLTYSGILGTKQNDATAKKGLTITDPGHFHGGWHVDALAGAIGANRTTLIHPINGSREPTTSVSTGITLNAGDAETRPANIGMNHIIKT